MSAWVFFLPPELSARILALLPLCEAWCSLWPDMRGDAAEAGGANELTKFVSSRHDDVSGENERGVRSRAARAFARTLSHARVARRAMDARRLPGVHQERLRLQGPRASSED